MGGAMADGAGTGGGGGGAPTQLEDDEMEGGLCQTNDTQALQTNVAIGKNLAYEGKKRTGSDQMMHVKRSA